MSSHHHYSKSTNPFEDDVDDETFLRNSRRPEPVPTTFDEQLQTLQQRRKEIESRTLQSTERSIGILRDSEQVGIATAEELARQREKLEKTDRQLDDINATLRFSQKHINGIKSVFSSLKNYMAGKSGDSPPPMGARDKQPPQQTATSPLDSTLSSYDRFDQHPTTRLRGQDYSAPVSKSTGGGSKEFSARLDANLQEMAMNIGQLKGLATDLSLEIDSQNDLIGGIIDKAETADCTIQRQNKDMNRILKK